jgi:uncharacterized protein (DUF427 family)
MMVESVWDYPRPPRIEPSPARIRVLLGGALIAETSSSFRVLETSHPPVYYIPLSAVAAGALQESRAGASFCEFKGAAVYYDVNGPGARRVAQAAWGYPDPSPAFAQLRDTVAFYPGAMDECTVDGELVTAQPGDFYGGWITSAIRGPFKGGPGTLGW